MRCSLGRYCSIRVACAHNKPRIYGIDGRPAAFLLLASSSRVYYAGVRVSELMSLTWSQVIRRDSGEAQLSVVGKDKDRGGTDPCRHRWAVAGQPGGRSGAGAGVRIGAPRSAANRACGQLHHQGCGEARWRQAGGVGALGRVHAWHAIDNGAPITLVSATLEHFLDGLLKTGRGENSLPGAPLSGRRSGTMPSYYA